MKIINFYWIDGVNMYNIYNSFKYRMVVGFCNVYRGNKILLSLEDEYKLLQKLLLINDWQINSFEAKNDKYTLWISNKAPFLNVNETIWLRRGSQRKLWKKLKPLIKKYEIKVSERLLNEANI